MSAEEKTRTSGEAPREQASGPILPTVNPDMEKTQPPKAAIPSFVYVMYVTTSLRPLVDVLRKDCLDANACFDVR
jgi:hypothetical protein